MPIAETSVLRTKIITEANSKVQFRFKGKGPTNIAEIQLESKTINVYLNFAG